MSDEAGRRSSEKNDVCSNQRKIQKKVKTDVCPNQTEFSQEKSSTTSDEAKRRSSQLSMPKLK